MMKAILLAALSVGALASFLNTSVVEAAPAAPAVIQEDDDDGEEPVDPEPVACYEIDSEPCQNIGCHETNNKDEECKSGSVWRDCNVAVPVICSNGTRCDQESGAVACP